MDLMPSKERLSVSVDSSLAAAGRAAVAAGRSDSLSAWVSAALARQAEHDARLDALDAFFEEYEAEHGAFTREEMDAARRRFSENATVVRGTAGTRGTAA